MANFAMRAERLEAEMPDLVDHIVARLEEKLMAEIKVQSHDVKNILHVLTTFAIRREVDLEFLHLTHRVEKLENTIDWLNKKVWAAWFAGLGVATLVGYLAKKVM